MAKKNVVITGQIPEVAERMIRGAGFTVVTLIKDNLVEPGLFAALLAQFRVDALIPMVDHPVTEQELDACPNLVAVANYGVGYNNVDVAGCTMRNILVGNTPDVLTEAVAELTVLHMVAAARRIRLGIGNVQKGLWSEFEPRIYNGPGLDHKTVGLIGMGRIGAAVARVLHFGHECDIVYCDEVQNMEAEVDFCAQRLTFNALLAESDFVSIHCPLTDITRGLMNANAFAKMKNTAVLVNTARGEIVDTHALLGALKSGQIFGAGLDVTYPEPLPPDHPLHMYCLITPHIGSATFEAREGMAVMAAENVIAVLRGERMPYCVNEAALMDIA